MLHLHPQPLAGGARSYTLPEGHLSRGFWPGVGLQRVPFAIMRAPSCRGSHIPKGGCRAFGILLECLRSQLTLRSPFVGQAPS